MSLIYIVKEGFSGFRRAKLSAAGSVLTIAIALLLLGLFYVISTNTSRIVESIRGRVEMEAFLLEPVTQQRIQEIQTALLATEGVERVQFISKEDAAKIFRQEFGEDIGDHGYRRDRLQERADGVHRSPDQDALCGGPRAGDRYRDLGDISGFKHHPADDLREEKSAADDEARRGIPLVCPRAVSHRGHPAGAVGRGGCGGGHLRNALHRRGSRFGGAGAVHPHRSAILSAGCDCGNRPRVPRKHDLDTEVYWGVGRIIEWRHRGTRGLSSLLVIPTCFR